MCRCRRAPVRNPIQIGSTEEVPVLRSIKVYCHIFDQTVTSICDRIRKECRALWPAAQPKGFRPEYTSNVMEPREPILRGFAWVKDMQ